MERYERTTIFLDQFVPENPDFLDRLERDAVRSGVPVMRRGTQGALRVILEMKKPTAILEIGTAVGFSAIFFSVYTEAQITTIENFPARIAEAKRNFAEMDVDRRVTLLEGDAADILPKLSGLYDFVFMDAAKGQYIALLPEIMRLLAPGGVLAADNVLMDGEILEPRFAVERRDRTVHRRMREYLKAVSEDERLVTTVLAAGDGLAVSVRR